MTKIFMVIFGLLTVIAIYVTAMDIGVYKPSIEKNSVRDGSAGHARYHGGYRRGK